MTLCVRTSELNCSKQGETDDFSDAINMSAILARASKVSSAARAVVRASMGVSH